MRRPHAAQWQLQKETVEVRVVRLAVAENNRNVTVQTVCGSAFANRNDARHRQRKVIHSLFAPFPRTPIPGLAQVGKQAPPTRAAPSLVRALRDARGSLLFATWTSPPSATGTSADCPDKATSSSRAYEDEPKPPERSRFKRVAAPVQ